MTTKTRLGNFFEDFRLGQAIVHAPPRTVTVGDVAAYTALFGSRFAVNSSDPFARTLGLPRAPIDSMLVFHLVFGRTVADVSLNAIANLGYAGGRFGLPVYPGDTLASDSKVIGLKANKDGKTGVVYVHSTGVNQDGHTVLDYRRWVMVKKRVNQRDADAPAPAPAPAPDGSCGSSWPASPPTSGDAQELASTASVTSAKPTPRDLIARPPPHQTGRLGFSRQGRRAGAARLATGRDA